MLNRLKVHGGILKDATTRLMKGAESTEAKILAATSHDETVPDEQVAVDVIGELAAMHLNDVENSDQPPRMPRYIEIIVKRVHTRDWRTVCKSLLLVHSCYRIGGPALLDELSKHSAKFAVPQKDFAETDTIKRIVTLSHHYGRYMAVRAVSYQSGVRHERLGIPDRETAVLLWTTASRSQTGTTPSNPDPIARAPLKTLNSITAQLLALSACEYPWSAARPPLVAAVAKALSNDAERLLSIGVAMARGMAHFVAVLPGGFDERAPAAVSLDGTAVPPAPTASGEFEGYGLLPNGCGSAVCAFASVYDEVMKWRRVSGDTTVPDADGIEEVRSLATKAQTFTASRRGTHADPDDAAAMVAAVTASAMPAAAAGGLGGVDDDSGADSDAMKGTETAAAAPAAAAAAPVAAAAEAAHEPTPEPVREPTPEPAREPTPEPAREPTPEPAAPAVEPATEAAAAADDDAPAAPAAAPAPAPAAAVADFDPFGPPSPPKTATASDAAPAAAPAATAADDFDPFATSPPSKPAAPPADSSPAEGEDPFGPPSKPAAPVGAPAAAGVDEFVMPEDDGADASF